MIYNYFQENNIKIKGAIHIGAHRGEDIEVYEKLGANKVVWVEPNPELFNEMQDYLDSRSTNIKSYLIKLAASDKDNEERDFFICYGPDAGYLTGNKGCSSLLKPSSDTMKSFYKDTIKVQTVKLDTIFNKDTDLDLNDFDTLNIDVQGAELEVLKGANNVLKKINFLYIEFSTTASYEGGVIFDDLHSFICSKGFKLADKYWQSNIEGDALYVK